MNNDRRSFPSISGHAPSECVRPEGQPSPHEGSQRSDHSFLPSIRGENWNPFSFPPTSREVSFPDIMQPLHAMYKPWMSRRRPERRPVAEKSKTKLYIKGLSAYDCDESLSRLVQGYGPTKSVRAIRDISFNLCVGKH